MEQPHNETVLVTKETFQAVGLPWTGTFAEAQAGGIRVVLTEMQNRLSEIQHVLEPNLLLGLSYHNVPGGFTHYAVVQVGEVEDIPEGMVSLTVPTHTYARCEHRKEQDITASYNHIYAWIEQQGYKRLEGDFTHLEEYPMQQDPYTPNPEFIIMIPIES